MKDSFGWQGLTLRNIVILLLGFASSGFGLAFQRTLFPARCGQGRYTYTQGTFLFNGALTNPGDKDGEKKSTDANNNSGYKFGDITRGVLGKLQSRVNSLTGKSQYEFGDLSKWLDAQAKEGAIKLDQAVKNQVQQFTQRPDYKFGDITKELIRRFQEGEYNAEDIWLFLRIMLIIGRHVLPPLAASLPVKVLMELIELSMAQSVSEDVTNMLTGEVDKRMKQWMVGDKDYRLGDISKKILKEKSQVVSEMAKAAAGKLTEKDVNEFGDITKNLWLRYSEGKKKAKGRKEDEATTTELPSSTGESSIMSHAQSGAATISPETSIITAMDESAMDAFEAWDKQFLAANKNKADESNTNATYFQQWDEALLEANRKGDSTVTLKRKQIEGATS